MKVLYPYKKRNLIEVLEKGFLNVLTGSCVGKSNFPVRVLEFDMINPFARGDLETVRERVFYWFPGIVKEVLDFYVIESPDESSLGFYIKLKLVDDSIWEIKV